MWTSIDEDGESTELANGIQEQPGLQDDTVLNTTLDTKSPVSNIVLNNDISREIASEIRNAALNQLYNSEYMQEHVAIVIYCDAICGHCNASRQQRGTCVDRLLRLLSTVSGYEAFLARIRNKTMHSINGNTSLLLKKKRLAKLEEELKQLQLSIDKDNDKGEQDVKDIKNDRLQKINYKGRDMYVNLKHLGSIFGSGDCTPLEIKDNFNDEDGNEVKNLDAECNYPTRENIGEWFEKVKGKYRLDRKLVREGLGKVRDHVVREAINNYDEYKEPELKKKKDIMQRENDIQLIREKFDTEFTGWFEIIFRRTRTPQNYFIYAIEWLTLKNVVNTLVEGGFEMYLNRVRNVLMHILNGNIHLQTLLELRDRSMIAFIENGKIVDVPITQDYTYMVLGKGGSELLSKLSTADSGADFKLESKDKTRMYNSNNELSPSSGENKTKDSDMKKISVIKENIFSLVDDTYLPTSTGTNDCLATFAQSFYSRTTVREQDHETDTMMTGIAHVEPTSVFAQVGIISALTDYSSRLLGVGRKNFRPAPQYNLTNSISLINASRISGTLSEVNQPLRINRDDIDGATMLTISQQVGDCFLRRTDSSCADVLLRLRLMQGQLAPFCFSGCAGGISNEGFQFVSPISQIVNINAWYWPMSAEASAFLDTRARMITLADIVQMAAGRIPEVPNWEVNKFGTNIAVVPVLNSWLNNATSMTVWTLAWMEYPYRFWEFQGDLVDDNANVLAATTGRTSCATVRVPGPNYRILYVLCDIAKTGSTSTWQLQVGLTAIPGIMVSDVNYLDAAGADYMTNVYIQDVANAPNTMRYAIIEVIQWWYDAFGAIEDVESVDLLMPELYGAYRILGKRFGVTAEGFFYNNETIDIPIPNYTNVGGQLITDGETSTLARLATTPLGCMASVVESDFTSQNHTRWDYMIGTGNWLVLITIAGRYAVAANKAMSKTMAEPWERTAYRYLLSAEKYGCAFDRVMQTVGMGEYEFYDYGTTGQKQYATNQWDLVKYTVKKYVYGQASCRQFSLLWNTNELNSLIFYSSLFPSLADGTATVGWKRTMPLFDEYFWPTRKIMPRDDYYSLSEMGYNYRENPTYGGYDQLINSEIDKLNDKFRQLIRTALTTGGYVVAIVDIGFLFISQNNGERMITLALQVGRADDAKMWRLKYANAYLPRDFSYREILIPQIHPLVIPGQGNAKMLLGLQTARNVTGRKVRGKFLPLMTVLSDTEPITGNPVTTAETYLYPQGVELDL